MNESPSPDPQAEAREIIAAWLGVDQLPDPLPERIATVVSRLFRRAEGAGAGGLASLSQTAGQYSFTQSYSPDAQAGGMWLNRTDKMLLSFWRKRGRAANVPMG